MLYIVQLNKVNQFNSSLIPCFCPTENPREFKIQSFITFYIANALENEKKCSFLFTNNSIFRISRLKLISPSRDFFYPFGIRISWPVVFSRHKFRPVSILTCSFSLVAVLRIAVSVNSPTKVPLFPRYPVVSTISQFQLFTMTFFIIVADFCKDAGDTNKLFAVMRIITRASGTILP